MAGSITAVVVHFSVYYGRLTPYMKEGTRNPGIASALAILSSLLVAGIIYYVTRKKSDEKPLAHHNSVVVEAR